MGLQFLSSCFLAELDNSKNLLFCSGKMSGTWYWGPDLYPMSFKFWFCVDDEIIENGYIEPTLRG